MYEYKPFDVIKNEKENLVYSDYLQTLEWLKVRERVLERDGNKCLKCEIQNARNPKDLQELRKINPELYITIVNDWISDKRNKNPHYDGAYELNQLPGLHVHHTYYIHGKLPWEYQDEVLQTLCVNCHKQVHEENKIKVYKDETLTTYEYGEICTKCDGTGFLPEYQYFENGVCFTCNGSGIQHYKIEY